MIPAQIRVMPGGFLVNRFGRAELEFAAAIIVRWHHVHSPEAWTTVTRRQIADFISADEQVREWLKNPFMQPDPSGLVAKGYIAGWESADAPGSFTPEGLRLLEHPGAWLGGGP